MSYSIYPRFSYITDITKAQHAVVTFTSNHDYTDGEIVSFRVSKEFGMYQINNQHARVLSHTDDTITVEIDTTGYDSFIYPVSGEVTPPVVVPSSSGIIPGQYTATMNLEDSFDNRRT